jgi:uncharacterized metal-binding protein YceD (DUF177 family)
LSIEVGEVTDQRVYTPITNDQQKIILPIYQSGSIDPEYTDEADSSYLGDLEVDLSDIVEGRIIIELPGYHIFVSKHTT